MRPTRHARCASWPRTAAKAAAGELDPGKAQLAARALEQTPPEHREDLDALVAEHAPYVDRRGLQDAVDRFHHDVAPDTLAAREARAREKRMLRT